MNFPFFSRCCAPLRTPAVTAHRLALSVSSVLLISCASNTEQPLESASLTTPPRSTMAPWPPIENLPYITLPPGPNRTVFEQLIALRSAKNMRIKHYSSDQLSMFLHTATSASGAKNEVRILYQILRRPAGERVLTAQAQRVSNADTQKERLQDLTKALSKPLQDELNVVKGLSKISHNGVK